VEVSGQLHAPLDESISVKELYLESALPFKTENVVEFIEIKSVTALYIWWNIYVQNTVWFSYSRIFSLYE
jgi:hypothetical protein